MTLDELHENTVAEGFQADLDRQYAPFPGEHMLDFGVIDQASAQGSGLAALPLRIAHGEHRGATNGYGIRHILLGHGEELARDEWFSVQDFVVYVIENFNAVCRDEKADRWHLVRVAPTRDEKHLILIVELDASGAFYRIVTGWMREGYRRLKNAPVWERRDCSTGPGVSGPP